MADMIMMPRFPGGHWRRWLAGGAILVVIAAGVLIWMGRGGRGLRRGARGGSGSTQQHGRGASRAQALEAVRVGRFDQAYEFYRLLPETEWAADDCFTIGTAFMERDRVVLGWAALEACAAH